MNKPELYICNKVEECTVGSRPCKHNRPHPWSGTMCEGAQCSYAKNKLTSCIEYIEPNKDWDE